MLQNDPHKIVGQHFEKVNHESILFLNKMQSTRDGVSLRHLILPVNTPKAANVGDPSLFQHLWLFAVSHLPLPLTRFAFRK